MNISYTLLIWEEVPETRKVYLIPNSVAHKYRDLFNIAHNTFINCQKMNDGLDFLSQALLDDIEYAIKDSRYYTNACEFVKYKIDNTTPIINKKITHVYISGFYL